MPFPAQEGDLQTLAVTETTSPHLCFSTFSFIHTSFLFSTSPKIFAVSQTLELSSWYLFYVISH